VTLTLHDVSGVPLYNGADEEAGPPATVSALHQAVRTADGLVMFSPEYSSSPPTVTENMIDWLSRDPSTWESTEFNMVAMAPGGRAGLGARKHFEAIMPRQASRLFPTIGFGNCSELFGDDGEVNGRTTLDELADFVACFAEHCASTD
jgi:NAD(P)H-dependent FMN reductase